MSEGAPSGFGASQGEVGRGIQSFQMVFPAGQCWKSRQSDHGGVIPTKPRGGDGESQPQFICQPGGGEAEQAVGGHTARQSEGTRPFDLDHLPGAPEEFADDRMAKGGDEIKEAGSGSVPGVGEG